MPRNKTYFEQRDNDNILKMREMLIELPPRCADFMRNIEANTTTLTRLGYLRDLRLFFDYLVNEVPNFADKKVTSLDDGDFDMITGRHIDLFSDYLTLYYKDDDHEIKNGERGKMRKLSALRSFFQFLFKNGYIHSNVATLIDLPKLHEKPILRLEIDEVARMLKAVETGEGLTERQQKYQTATQVRDLAMISLFLGTGIRVSECIGLNINDFDFSNNSFRVTRKGGDQMILYFPDEVAQPLKAYIELRKEIDALPGHEDALFLSTQRKRMTVRAAEYLVKKYAHIAAPLKTRISPHKLRSTFGTNLYNETGDIYLVADVLGHSSVDTTRKHYAAMTEDRRRMAASHVKLREEPEKDDSNIT